MRNEREKEGDKERGTNREGDKSYITAVYRGVGRLF